nr:zinc finger protein 316-like [Pogona vitticeps]
MQKLQGAGFPVPKPDMMSRVDRGKDLWIPDLPADKEKDFPLDSASEFPDVIIKVEEEEEESWLPLKGESEKLLLNSPPQGKETSLGAASGS